MIAKKELIRVILDSTVQEKAIAHPSDCKLLETAWSKVVGTGLKSILQIRLTCIRSQFI